MGSSWDRRGPRSLALGLFASTAINANSSNGLLYGNPGFLGIQAVAVAISAIWAFVFTYVMLFLIDKVTPVRADPHMEEMGLDEAELGEVAYPES